ncbi:MAG: DUF6572 domain-containing protein [Acidimicrobiales bacterium]
MSLDGKTRMIAGDPGQGERPPSADVPSAALVRHPVQVLGRRKKEAEAAEAAELPSGIETPDKIDLVALPPDESSVDLYIVQNVEWNGSDRRLNLLQEKIQNYVGFAVYGQLAATYPEHVATPWRIVIDCQTPPDSATAAVLDELVAPIARYGGALIVRLPNS